MKSLQTEAIRICGCDISPNGTIALTDFMANKCVIGINLKGKHLYTISTAPFNAFDVTCVNDITVAVSSGVDRVISIVDISSRTVKKHINVGYWCYGLTHRDGTLLVCAVRHGILSINLTNEKITTIIQCRLSSYSYLTVFKNRLYFTDDESEAVTCCDLKGRIIWTFTDNVVLRCPRGISTDHEGRVYVCDSEKHKVIVLSAHGKGDKKIISSLCWPTAICFNSKTNTILVANHRHELILFNVSSKISRAS